MLDRTLQFGLNWQLARLMAQAESLKERAIGGVKHKAVALAVTAALAVVGLIFVLIALAVGLVALYVWLAPQFGSLAALGIVGGSCLGVALLLFLIVALRGGGRASAPVAKAEEPPARRFARGGHPLANAARAVADEAIDSATEAVRNSPREAVLGAVAMAVVLGFMIGRR